METELVYLEARVMALVERVHELQRDNATLHETLLKNKDEALLLHNENQSLQAHIEAMQADREAMQADRENLLSAIAESANSIRQLMARLPVKDVSEGEPNE